MRAVWGVDYDYQKREYRDCPVCPECDEPVWRLKDGEFHCLCCDKIVDIDPDMEEYFESLEGDDRK